MNMKKQNYWKAVALKKDLFFRMKKSAHNINELIWKAKYESPIFIRVAFEAIKQLLLCGIIAFILFRADIFVDNKWEITINNNAFFSFLLSGLSVAGIILGLYCSNIISIYSSIYVNAPTHVSELFQNDLVTNKSIKSIINYIILNLIVLVEHVSGIHHSFVTVVVLSSFIVYVVVYYSKTRNRTLQLSNTYSISHRLYVEIMKSIKRVSTGRYYSQDINYQAFYQKKSERELQTLSDLARFNTENSQNRNSSMLEFMKNNLNLIAFYWRYKKSIPFDSEWFKERPIYKQWHWASDHEIQIALHTGTTIQPSRDRDCNWFEDNLVKINNICFDKLCESNDYHSIYEYLYAFATLQENAASADTLHFSLQAIFSLQEKIQSIYKDEKTVKKAKSDGDSTLPGIVELMVGAYTEIVLGINKLVDSIDITALLENAKGNYCFSKIDFSKNPFLNNSAIQDLYRCIETELEIEKHVITPTWHIHQVIAQIVYNHLCEMVEIFNRIANVILPSFGEFFEKKKIYTEAMIVYSKIAELLSKENVGCNTLNSLFPTLLAMHKESNVIWEENPYDEYKQATRKTVMSLPQNWMECSTKYALNHWTRREEHPDLLGFCYNNFCEFLIASIEENDLDRFQAAYPNFLRVMFLYQEYIRNDLLKVKEKYRQGIVFHVWTAPFFEYALISGFAIIWGELNSNMAWANAVSKSISDFIESDSSSSTSTLIQWSNLVMRRRHDVLGIGNRDVLNTNWEIRISNAIENLSTVEYEYGPFGNKTIKTDSKIVKAFLGDSFSDFGLHDVEDVFFISCVNKYLPAEQKYKSRFGWERVLEDETSETE